MIPILVAVLKNVKKGMDKISHHESPKKVDTIKQQTANDKLKKSQDSR